jgi:type I restriction enzyme S subunit
MPNNFKQTEIGLIPEDWGVVRLEEVAEKMKAGGTPSTKENSYWNGDIPFVLIEDMTSAGKYLYYTNARITKAGVENSSTWIVPENCIVFSLYGTAGKPVINKMPVAITQNMVGIIPNTEKGFIDYLYYALSHSRSNLWKLTDISVHKHITMTASKRIPIPLPPLPEQRKIAGVLSTIQCAIEQQDKIIEATKKLKKSLMQKLLSEGLNGEEQKETEIGLIPKSWEVVRLGEVCEPRKETIEPAEQGLKYIGLEHIDSGETKIERFGLDSEVRSTKSRFYEGDILYGKLRPYLDKAAIVDFNGICSTDITVIRATTSKVVAGYIVNLLHLPSFVSFAASTMTGVNHPRTSWRAISAFGIPLPPLPEQQEIAHILSTVDKKIEVEERRKATLRELFKTMLRKLMTGEVRVKDIEL